MHYPRALIPVILGLGLILPTLVAAQAWVPRKGRLSTWATYQNFLVEEHCFSEDYIEGGQNFGNCFDFGNIRSQSVTVGVDLGIVDKLALAGNLAFVAAKYYGGTDFGDAEAEIDDGSWHEGFQDFGMSLRYMLLADPVVITPEVAYGAPTHGYETLGHSALGRGLQEGRFGVNLGWVPSFLDRAYAHANYSYSVVEKVETLDGRMLDMNRSNVGLAMGYFVIDSFSARAFGAYRKIHGGIDWTELDENTGHVHDQAAATEDGTLGFELGYSFSPRLVGSMSYSWVAWGVNTHNGGALSLGLSSLFDIYGP